MRPVIEMWNVERFLDVFAVSDSERSTSSSLCLRVSVVTSS